jgi:transmembrane sensor
MRSLLAELYTRYSAELRSYLERRFGAATAEAEDVVHQAFMNLAALDEPAVVQNPRAYLYRTTHHILIDERRRLSSWRRGVAPSLIDGCAQADEITPERVLIAKEHLALLGRVIGRLPRARRRSLLLNRMHGLSCAEIARRDGYSESAVKKHITLAMAELDAGLADRQPREARRPVRRVAASMLVVGLAVVVAATWFMGRRSPSFAADYVTAIAEIRDIALPDGTVMTLGAGSSAAVRFNAERREVTLLRGEAFFSVGHRLQQPFLVMVERNVVRDVGTKFEVRRGSAEIRVGVLEGRVEVAQQSAQAGASAGTAQEMGARHEPAAPQVLAAGQGIRADFRGDVGAVEKVGTVLPGAWRSGRRTYIDVPLREIVADINRYSPQRISIADPRLEDLRLSVSFQVAHPQQLLSSVELALPVEVDRQKSGDIVLRSRGGPAIR